MCNLSVGVFFMISISNILNNDCTSNDLWSMGKSKFEGLAMVGDKLWFS